MSISTSLRAVLVFIIAAMVLQACKDEVSTVGEVAGEPITTAEFEAYLKFKRIQTEDGEKLDETLLGYLERKALTEAIEKNDLLDNSLLQVEIDEFKKQMLVGRYFERYLTENVTDKSVAAYYNAHKKEYQDNKIHAAHILLRTNARMSETEKASQLTKVKEAYAKISEGVVFEEVAAEYSEDKISKKKGGDLGWLKEGSVDPDFSKKIFSMAKDQVSEPFETPFGYHIVRIVDDIKVVSKPLNAVQGSIRYQLRAEAKKAELERLTKSVQMKKGKYKPTAKRASK